MKTIKMEDSMVKSVHTLNTWGEEEKAEIASLLEKGYWVHLGSTAIGHTRAWMTEQDGLDWVRSEYGDRLEEAEREGYGWTYCRLRKEV